MRPFTETESKVVKSYAVDNIILIWRSVIFITVSESYPYLNLVNVNRTCQKKNCETQRYSSNDSGAEQRV